jgi:hypothetical protein
VPADDISAKFQPAPIIIHPRIVTLSCPNVSELETGSIEHVPIQPIEMFHDDGKRRLCDDGGNATAATPSIVLLDFQENRYRDLSRVPTVPVPKQ